VAAQNPLAIVAWVYGWAVHNDASREAWIAFIPMFLAFAALYKRARGALVVIMILALMYAPFIMPKQVHERVRETFAKDRTYEMLGKKFEVSESAAARIDALTITLQRLSERPILGYGVPGGAVIDNQYSRILTETGFTGFLAFCG